MRRHLRPCGAGQRPADASVRDTRLFPSHTRILRIEIPAKRQRCHPEPKLAPLRQRAYANGNTALLVLARDWPGYSASCRIIPADSKSPGRSLRCGADAKGETMALMAGKQGLIMGVANERSLAWGIAKAISEQGAELA